MQDFMTAVLYFRRCDRILTLVFVRNERVDHIFFQYPDVPTAMLDLLKLAPLYHTVDTGRLELHDLADLLDGQHRRILPVIAFQRFLCRITRHKKPPLRRKRKHNSVDVSYSVFKLLFADHRGQRTSSVGYFYTAPVENNTAKEYYDDNGTKYREGDSLLPNTQFEVRGYQYETDDQGRVVSAEGQLRMRDPSYEREMEDVRKIDGQEYKTTDDRGHLIGHQFDGSDKLENLVPMDAKLNQGDFVKLENTLADAVKDGADVKLKVEPVYEGDSTRPTEFRVTYSIDGDKDAVVFKNESEAKHDE